MVDHEFENDMVRITKGDADALKNIYTAYWHAVYAFSISILHNHHSAEDVSQEVFVKIWENAGSYHIGSNPKAWIMRITRNESIDLLRRKKSEISIDDEVAENIKEDYDLEESVLSSITLDEFLSSLHSDISQIITLNVIGGLPLRAISRIMKMPLATVSWKYNKGISTLKNRIISNERNEKNE